MISRKLVRSKSSVRRISTGLKRSSAAPMLMAILAIALTTGCGDSAGPLGNGDRPQRQLYGEPPQTSSSAQAPPTVAPPAPPVDATASTASPQPPGLPPIPGAAPPVPGDPNAAPGQPGLPSGGNPMVTPNPLMASPPIAYWVRTGLIAGWKLEDFQRAKAQRDRAVIEGIAYLGKCRTREDSAARILVNLLTKKIDDSQVPPPGAAPGPVGWTSWRAWRSWIARDSAGLLASRLSAPPPAAATPPPEQPPSAGAIWSWR